MKFIIADTFMKSLVRLERDEQGLVKQAAFEFQAQPDSPGFSFHKLERARDQRFWSFRVNRDLRIIVHRDGASSLMLCYAAHHDVAYHWAERRSLDVHPTTGAAQFVEIRERVEEVVRQVVRETEPPLFAGYEKSYLLGLGVPPEWVDPLATVGESAFMEVVDQLPQEAAERLMDLAAGKAVPLPPRPPSQAPAADPLQHPDAQRRFRSVETQSELQAALDAPWDLWRIFLHPEQRAIVEQRASGPARVTGGAGTGKSVVALHRAAFLARSFPSHRVLLTTFSKALAVRLEHSLELLLAGDLARARIDVRHLHALATGLALAPGQTFTPASADDLGTCIEAALKGRTNDWLNATFLRSEWEAIVDAHAITRFDAYKAISRKGRGVPLSAKKRTLAWAALEAVHAELARRRLGTFNLLCATAAQRAAAEPPYQHAIIDECQDFGPAELRLIRALVEPGESDLFFCGDEGQRIYKPSASWLSLGIDVRGRSSRLTLNYRTTEQIRRRADALLPSTIADGDGQTEERHMRSVLSGPPPELQGYPGPAEEQRALADWLRARRDEGMALHEIAVFARTGQLISERVTPALRVANIPSQGLEPEAVPGRDRVVVGTMHGAKGLEFRAVAVVGCDRDQLPLRRVASRIRDEGDKHEFIDHERHLLYVACTRARERLRVTWSGAGCEWLGDSRSSRR